MQSYAVKSDDGWAVRWQWHYEKKRLDMKWADEFKSPAGIFTRAEAFQILADYPDAQIWTVEVSLASPQRIQLVDAVS